MVASPDLSASFGGKACLKPDQHPDTALQHTFFSEISHIVLSLLTKEDLASAAQLQSYLKANLTEIYQELLTLSSKVTTKDTKFASLEQRVASLE